uniref:UEV domain-containing protein n=1 Tax=Phytophthora ramorum TaxID=164328 RepID=H3GRU5_PHYRM
MYANNVSNLDQILSSLQCYPQSSRVRGDVYNLLGQIPSLQPNCGTFGSTLLNLEGTIPIFYRSNQYNIPVEFWVVETYPLAPPVCFVRPTADMMVKPGHPHVTSDGYVKIPYTSDWRSDFTLLELVAHMCSIFGNMPPVFRRPANSRLAPYQNRLSGSSASANGSGTGGYFQQGSYAQSHPPQPSPFYSAQFQAHAREQDLAASGGPREGESLFGGSQHSVGGASSLSSSGVYPVGRASGEVRPEDRATTLKTEVTGKIQVQLEKIFKRVRDDIDLQFEHEVQLTQSRENVERGLQSLRFLRDDITRAKGVVEAQDKEVTAWLEENEGKDTVDPDTILIEGDALSKQYVLLRGLESAKSTDLTVVSGGFLRRMIKTLAEHYSIEDALYYMDRALSNDEIELSVFLKEVRKLARKQFMCSALVQKIHAKQQELAASSYHSSPRS